MHNGSTVTRILMVIKKFITVSFVLFISGQSFAWDHSGSSLLSKTVFGILVHDRGPASDRHETGVDPNWELQFNPPEWKPWRWIASPFPTVGATPNFTGDTSVLYGGLTYEMSLSNQYADDLTYDITKHLFVGAGISAALHNGPLHKLPHDLLPEWRLKRSSGFKRLRRSSR